jgi:preprotein translocase subunit SecA
MLKKLVHALFGSRNDRLLKKMQPMIEAIGALEPSMAALSDEALQSKTAEFKQRFQQGETLDALLVEAFAVGREASKRTLSMRHFDVQLMGGIVLHQHKIAEMGTGEGKTLVATLAAYLNALSGNSVHIVTVNDYLAKRDADWMAPLYTALGLTVGVVIPNQSRAEKLTAYRSDVVYATNNELGFDYLRDRMAYRAEDQVQGPLVFAIVDEVDSILIDESRTPLIISGAAENSSELYLRMNDEVIPHLLVTTDYTLDEKSKQAFLTEEGHQKVEQLLSEMGLLHGSNLYDPHNINLMHHLNAALRAHTLFKKDVDYLVSNDQIIIVDEHTGRAMMGRRWSDGLHQAMEAKEKVAIQQENQTLASITFQNFFRLYSKLAGMTGTADTEAFEFHHIYGLEVVVMPTNKPCQRLNKSDQIYLTQAEKFDAILAAIEDCQKRGQPTLVGTISIEASEHLSQLLHKRHIAHNVLNAKYHEQEARIVAEAGRPGAVTIATNMAGRGTDIVLGGSLEAESDREAWQQRHDAVIAVGGLHIIGTERHESRRIDNQLRGRSGRQGDPGSSLFFLSLEDNLMRIFASDKLLGIMRKLGVQKNEAITHPWVTRAIENAQRKVEGHHFDIRKQLLQYDDVANEQRKAIYEERDALLRAEDVSHSIENMRDDVLSLLLSRHMPADSLEEQWDIPGLTKALQQTFGLAVPLQEWLADDKTLDAAKLKDILLSQLADLYAQKAQMGGDTLLRDIEKSVVLHTLDVHWKEHLAALDSLRQSIHLRGYAQKDPKQEYKREAFALFERLLELIKLDIVGSLYHLQIKPAAPPPSPIAEKKSLVYPSGAIVARNDPCPCGSDKKFKQCHGVLVER